MRAVGMDFGFSRQRVVDLSWRGRTRGNVVVVSDGHGGVELTTDALGRLFPSHGLCRVGVAVVGEEISVRFVWRYLGGSRCEGKVLVSRGLGCVGMNRVVVPLSRNGRHRGHGAVESFSDACKAFRQAGGIQNATKGNAIATSAAVRALVDDDASPEDGSHQPNPKGPMLEEIPKGQQGLEPLGHPGGDHALRELEQVVGSEELKGRIHPGLPVGCLNFLRN